MSRFFWYSLSSETAFLTTSRSSFETRFNLSRLIGSCDDNNRAAQAFRPEALLDEFEHFATALADQCDHIDVRFHVARDHSQQRAFADAAAGEDADALSAADGQHCIDRFDSGLEDAAYARSGEWIQRLLEQAVILGEHRHRLAVERTAERIDYAPKQFVAD